MDENDQPAPQPPGPPVQVVTARTPAGRPIETVETDPLSAQHWATDLWTDAP